MPGDGNEFWMDQQLSLLQDPQYLDAAMRGEFGPRAGASQTYVANPMLTTPGGAMPVPSNYAGPAAAANLNTQRQIEPLQAKIQALAAQIAQAQQPAAAPNQNTAVPQPFKPRPSAWDPSKFSTGPSTGLPPLVS